MLIGRSLGRGVFRVLSKENSEDLTNKGGEHKESATNCQKTKGAMLALFPTAGRPVDFAGTLEVNGC